MKKIIFVLLVAVASACSSAKHTATTPTASPSTAIKPPIAGADGSSFEKAIVIQEITETKGVDAEYRWLSVNYPGYKRGSQALVSHEKIPYDILTVTTADGAERKFYFDISNYFGKF
jgi:hypothetical protein